LANHDLRNKIANHVNEVEEKEFDTARKEASHPMFEPIQERLELPIESRLSNKIHALDESFASELNLTQQIQDRSWVQQRTQTLDEYTEHAIKVNKLPIKLTWKDVNFTVV